MRKMIQQEQQTWWTVEIDGMEDFDMSMKRVYAAFYGAELVCDFSTLISPAFFREFGLPILQRECRR